MARSAPTTRLPLTVVLAAALLAIALAAFLVFGRQPATVEDEPTVRVPPAADTPAPMPTPTPATTPAP